MQSCTCTRMGQRCVGVRQELAGCRVARPHPPPAPAAGLLYTSAPRGELTGTAEFTDAANGLQAVVTFGPVEGARAAVLRRPDAFSGAIYMQQQRPGEVLQRQASAGSGNGAEGAWVMPSAADKVRPAEGGNEQLHAHGGEVDGQQFFRAAPERRHPQVSQPPAAVPTCPPGPGPGQAQRLKLQQPGLHDALRAGPAQQVVARGARGGRLGAGRGGLVQGAGPLRHVCLLSSAWQRHSCQGLLPINQQRVAHCAPLFHAHRPSGQVAEAAPREVLASCTGNWLSHLDWDDER